MAQTMIGVTPLHSRILVGIYDDGNTTMTLGGKPFYLLGDDMGMARDVKQTHPGLRPRWAITLAVSDEVHKNGDVVPGQKVLMDQLKWSRGIPAKVDGRNSKVWSIPVEDILLVGPADEFSPEDRQQIARLFPDWENWTTTNV